MAEGESRLGALFRELRERRVFRVAVVYGIVAFVVLQVADLVFPALLIPAWGYRLLAVLLFLGFPVALVLAWAFELTPEGVRLTASPTAGAAGAGRRATRGRGIAVAAIAGLIVLGGVGAVWLTARGHRVTPLPTSRSVVAILPFTVSGGDEFDDLSEGMVTLLSTKLDGAGELRSVDPRALLSFVARELDGAPSPREGRRIARQFGAGLYVLGDVVESGSRLQLTASLYDLDAGDEPVVESSADGSPDQLFAMVDEVASDLLGGIGGASRTRVSRIAAVTTSSFPALKAYLEGEAAFRAGLYEPAVQAFERAVAEDSAFALAYYRLSQATEWLTWGERAQEAAERAFRHAERLADRDRRFLEALLMMRRGVHDRAEALFRSATDAYPDDVDAWFQLGEVLFHTNPRRGRPMSESRAAFERVLAFQPDDVSSLVHLARIAADEGDTAEVHRIVGHILEVNPGGGRELEMLALDAFVRGDSALEAEVIDRLDTAGASTLGLVMWAAGLYSGNPEAGLQVAERMSDPAHSEDVRISGLMNAATMLMAGGRWHEAVQQVGQIAAFDRVRALEFHGWLASLPFAPASLAELSALRDSIAALDLSNPPHSDDPSVFFSVHNDLHEEIRLYLLGVLSVRLADTAAAEEYAAQLAAMSGPPISGSLTEDLSRGIRARIESVRGDPSGALSVLVGAPMQTFYERSLASAFYNQVAERFLRAELLRELGRSRDALAWYEQIGTVSPIELAYVPMAILRRAEIHEELGDDATAVELYGDFVAMWEMADPDLQPRVEQARARLAALEERMESAGASET